MPLNPNTEDWSERLCCKMRELGINQAALARRTHLPATIIAKYCGGVVDNPRGDKLERIARELAVDKVWLRYGIGEEHSREGQVSG